MPEKQETIFRQKSVDRVSSPEELDKYLKVTSPRVWVVLIGIIFILVGVIAWGSFGKLKTYANVGCVVEKGQAYCYVNEEDGKKIKVGMSIEIPSEEKEIEIISFDTAGITIPDTYNYLQHLVGVTSEDYVRCLYGSSDLSEGYYAGKIVVESISPLKFIFN